MLSKLNQKSDNIIVKLYTRYLVLFWIVYMNKQASFCAKNKWNSANIKKKAILLCLYFYTYIYKFAWEIYSRAYSSLWDNWYTLNVILLWLIVSSRTILWTLESLDYLCMCVIFFTFYFLCKPSVAESSALPSFFTWIPVLVMKCKCEIVCDVMFKCHC